MGSGQPKQCWADVHPGLCEHSGASPSKVTRASDPQRAVLSCPPPCWGRHTQVTHGLRGHPEPEGLKVAWHGPTSKGLGQETRSPRPPRPRARLGEGRGLGEAWQSSRGKADKANQSPRSSRVQRATCRRDVQVSRASAQTPTLGHRGLHAALGENKATSSDVGKSPRRPRRVTDPQGGHPGVPLPPGALPWSCWAPGGGAQGARLRQAWRRHPWRVLSGFASTC